MKVTDSDARYAAWWEPPLLFLLIVIAAAAMDSCHNGQLRDLQRRVGQLESERR